MKEKEPFPIYALPPSLRKALVGRDRVYEYGLRTKNGDVFLFQSASMNHPDFVTLKMILLPDGDDEATPFHGGSICFNFYFGNDVDVRISDIVWCAEDPFLGRFKE